MTFTATLTTAILLVAASSVAFSTATSSEFEPSRSCGPVAAPPSPIPFPYIPSGIEYADDDPNYDPEDAADFDDSEYWLPSLPFEYHHPTGVADPENYFPWSGIFKRPKIFYPEEEEEEEVEEVEEIVSETTPVRAPPHQATPILILNPELEGMSARSEQYMEDSHSQDADAQSSSREDDTTRDDDEELIEKLLRDGRAGEIRVDGSSSAIQPTPARAPEPDEDLAPMSEEL